MTGLNRQTQTATGDGLRAEYTTSAPVLPDGKKQIHLGSGIVKSILGEGGTSIVYEVWNERLGVKRAVKVMKPSANTDSVERFHREVRILAQLNHPNIINVHSVGQWETLPYIEMDMVDGVPLDELIKETGALPTTVALAIAIDVARALDYTHSHHYKIHNVEYQGLLHRDIKPANIMLPNHDNVRLTDFGIASLNTSTSTGVAKTGTITGSMQYLAPELLEDSVVDARSDIYSFGCVLYEMFSGEKVFPEKIISRLVKKRVINDYTSIKKLKLRLPVEIEKLIESCLSKKPDMRPTSMKTVLTTLEQTFFKVSSSRPEELITQYMNRDSGARATKTFQANFKKKKSGVTVFLITTFSFLAFILAAGGGAYWYAKYQNPELWENFTDTLSATPQYSRGVVIRNSSIEDELDSSSKTRPVVKTVASDNSDSGEKSTIEKTSFLENQFEVFGSNDTMGLLRELLKTQDYSLLISSIKHLPKQTQAQKEVRLLKHRASIAMGLESRAYYENSHISDAEFYLSKGKYLYHHKKYQRAVWVLKVAGTTPSLLLNKEKVSLDMYYYIAKSETAHLKTNRTDTQEAKAINGWLTLISQLPEGSTHQYVTKAKRELKKIQEGDNGEL
jgi:serine/threonine protein kinase